MRPGGVDPLSRQDNVSNVLLRCRPVITLLATRNHLQSASHTTPLTHTHPFCSSRHHVQTRTPLLIPLHPHTPPTSPTALSRSLSFTSTSLVFSSLLVWEGCCSHPPTGVDELILSSVCSIVSHSFIRAREPISFWRVDACRRTLSMWHAAWLSGCLTRILQLRGYPGEIGGICHQ